MLTNSGRDSANTGVTGTITHIALITAITSWRAGTITEASYTGYARVAVTWGAAADTSDSAGRKVANSGALNFPENTGSDQTVIGWAGYTASSGGTCKAIGLLDTDQPIIGNVIASDDLIRAPAHGLSADQRVYFLKVPHGTVPDTFSENTAYYVLAAGLTADVFALSATSGGAAINTTNGGVGQFIPYTAQTIASNGTPSIADGAIIIKN